MGVKIEILSLNNPQPNPQYAKNDKIVITVQLYNDSAQESEVFLETILRGQFSAFPVTVRQIEIRLQPKQRQTVEIYNLLVDATFPTDDYTVLAQLANQFGEGSRRQTTFRV